MNTDEEYWDRIYREGRLEEIPWHSEEPPHYLVDLLKKKKIKIGLALDVCAGAGTNAVYLAKKGFEVTGVDISQTAIKYAKQRCEKAGVSNKCKFFAGDVTKIQFPKGKFDFVFDRGCYHSIGRENRKKFPKIISDTLKRGGKYSLICFSDKNPPWERNVSKEEIRDNFSKLFKIGKIRELEDTEKTGEKLYFYLALMTKK